MIFSLLDLILFSFAQLILELGYEILASSERADLLTVSQL